MVSYLDLSVTRKNAVRVVTEKGKLHCATRCKSNNESLPTDSRASIYQKTVWSHDFIVGLESNFSMNCKEKVEKLEEKVTTMLNDYENGGSSILQLLELVDDIERLGLGYRFQTNITSILNKVASTNEIKEEDNLHAVSLKFRLLRQHDYSVSQGVFKRFKDSNGGFIGCLQTDVKAVLSLYEASYLAFESELDLHEAKLFTTENMLKLSGDVNQEMADHISHALDVPLYRRMHRLEARWYIGAYSKRKDANKFLLDLAILDFNMVQSVHKRDLQKVSKWWEDLGLASKLSFTRDRVMECFFGSVGVVFEPQYYSCRVGLTKACALINTIDDIFDIYGSVDELKVFTNAVKRWDINEVEHMPEYLKLGFLALYNTINEMGYESLITQGKSIIPTLARVWGEFSEAMYVEAKWNQTNYMPTLEDYLDNAWRSSSAVVILTHVYVSMNQDVKTDSLGKCHDLLKWSSMICRLHNDLATSSDEMDRGKNANAISCYMQENGVCEEVARGYINTLIDKAWSKMIEARIGCSKHLACPFVDSIINLARVVHCTCQYGDGLGAPDARAKDRILSVIIDPISVKDKDQYSG
ncbi:hypothetical protein L1987_68875 [Smallanthus sonchifolius]|uniref:Uncharacterized protein n=1 Tax=Smallanthus sonchifolius TaxID=185202 RepID=A0ACB9B4B8_9ASTR|nr:hypothetical protein L1987_68875 [Smallanthus sonchifolius]